MKLIHQHRLEVARMERVSSRNPNSGLGTNLAPPFAEMECPSLQNRAQRQAFTVTAPCERPCLIRLRKQWSQAVAAFFNEFSTGCQDSSLGTRRAVVANLLTESGRPLCFLYALMASSMGAGLDWAESQGCSQPMEASESAPLARAVLLFAWYSVSRLPN